MRRGDRGYFETSWKFATAGNPLAEQEDLARRSQPRQRRRAPGCSFVQMADCSAGETNTGFTPECLADGLEVNVWEYDDDIAVPDPDHRQVRPTHGRLGLAAGAWPTPSSSQAWFFDGVDNDHVKVCVDGSHVRDRGLVGGLLP